MDRKQALRTLWKIEQEERSRQRLATERQAAEAAAAERQHWVALIEALNATQGDAVLAVADPTPPEDWSADSNQYLLEINLHGHATIQARYCYIAGYWEWGPWIEQEEPSDRAEGEYCWRVCDAVPLHYRTLAAALVAAADVLSDSDDF